MTQSNLNIADETFPQVRADLNNALQSLGTLSSGSTAPSTTYPYQLWADTSTNLLKIRSSDNQSWITWGRLNTSFFVTPSDIGAATVNAYQPTFSLVRNSATVTLSNASTITFSTAEFDTNSAVNSYTTFIVPDGLGGKYVFHSSGLYTNNASSTSAFNIYLYVNNSNGRQLAWTPGIGSGAQAIITGSTMLNLNARDTVAMACSGSSSWVYGNSNSNVNYFTGYRIGA